MIKTVYNFKKINTDNIFIKKPIKYGKNIIKFPIKYKDNRKLNDLILQSSKLYLPFQISSFNNYFIIDYSFCNVDFDEEQHQFLILLNEINVKIKKLIKTKKINCYFKNKKMVNSLKSKFMYPNILRTKILNKDQKYFEVYDQNKKMTNFDELKNSTYCKSILLLSDLWISINKKSYGLSWITLQIKLEVPLYLKGYSFIDESQIDNSEYSEIQNNEVYQKYFKMIKMGIPKPAVRQKMVMNGDDPNILDLDSNSALPDKFLKKKKPLVVKNLLANVQLKKTVIKKKIKSKKRLGNAPSLEEILNSKKKLKDTGLIWKLL